MKYKSLNYSQCVDRAISLVQNYKTTKYEICLIALRVCDIQKGGHQPNSKLYTMKKFAIDIGMNVGTLRKWMEEHRNVVQKLPNKPKAQDYKVIREVLKEVNNKTDIKKVRELYNKYSSYKKEDHLLLCQIKNAKSIRNFVQDHVLSEFNTKDVQLLKDLLKQSLDHLEKPKAKKNLLTRKSKGSKIKVARR